MSRVIEENGRRSAEKELWSDKKRTIFGLPISFTKYTLTDTRLINSVNPCHHPLNH